MKKMLNILCVITCIIAILLSDPYIASAKTDEAETASKTVRISTLKDKGGNSQNNDNSYDEDDLGPGERSREEEENRVVKEDGNSEKTENYLIERMDISEMTEIRIGTYEEWMEFAKKCTLDSWSKDKYVVITDVIDFNMKEFMPVPYFAGVLDGNNNTLNKVAFTGNGNYIGVFSKTAPTAVIRNLNVIGVMKPEDKPFNIGGIAGENAGMIAGCKYDGYVEGQDYIGGIAGYNDSTGIISACTVTGKISGLHHVGGICGANVGLVTGCSANADINTVTKEKETSIKDIKVEELFTSLINEGRQSGNKMSIRSSSNPVDIGGIVGHNVGEVSTCTNGSKVGYEHVGYNVGGIAGRQSGYVHDCTNEGFIQGRKDVGGIVGQAEPYIRLDLSADIISQISTAINSLHDSVDKTIKDTDNSSGVVSARLNVIKSFADKALGDTGYLANSTTDFINGVTGATNEIVGRLEYVIDETSKNGGPMDNVSNAGKHLRDAAQDLEEVVEDLDVDNYLDDSEKSRYDNAKKAIDDATKEYERNYDYYLNDTSPAVSAAREAARVTARDAYIAEKWPGKTYAQLDDSQKAEADAAGSAAIPGWASDQAINKYDTDHAPNTYADVMSDNAKVIAGIILEHSDEMIDDAEEDGKESLKDVKRMASDLNDAGSQLKGIIGNVAGRSNVTFPQLSDEYRLHTNSLVANIQAMSDNLGFLNSEMKGSTDAVCVDLEGVNDDFSTVMLLITDAMDGALDMDYSNVFEDESNDVCEDSVDATVTKCINTGNIYADVNTGGITGTMAQEYDFDLEGDLTGIKNAAKKSTYRTKCVLRDNTNRGYVKGKKSYVGGICGLHEIGTILRCNGFAKVSSESGDYVGGIAGRSYSTIRNSDQKGALAGGSYIGGITGAGEDIIDCIAMPTILEGTDFKGAVAGQAGDGGKISGNIFVSDTLAGVDRISLDGRAYPVSYRQLLEIDGIPSEYSLLKVDFIVDGKSVANVTKRYGEVVTPSETPIEAEVAQKGEKNKKNDDIKDDVIILTDDEYIDWDCDEEIPVYEDMEITGEIRRYTTSLASEITAENKQSVLIVDGRFTTDDNLTVEPSATNSETLEEYLLRIPDDGAVTHRIRYQIPDEFAEQKIYVKNGNEYVEVSQEPYGKYTTFTADGNEVYVRVEITPPNDLTDQVKKYALIAGGIIAALLLIKVIIHLVRIKVSKKTVLPDDFVIEDLDDEKSAK